MELRHLRYFIAVGENESVRVASAKLHISQPAVSRQIQDLEEELGFALFERSARGVKLTRAGQFFMHEAQRIVAQLDSASRDARLVANGLQGRLRLGFVENAGWDGLVPAALSEFQREAPDMRLEVLPLNTPEQLHELEAGTLDGGFVYVFESLASGMKVRPLTKHNVVLAVPRRWNMGDRKSVPARSLCGRPFVTFPRAVYPAYFDRLIAASSSAGLTMQVVQEASTEAAILSLVSAGIGAAIVNSQNQARPPALAQFIKLSDLSIPLPLAFAYPANARNPALTRFLATLDAVTAQRKRLRSA